MRNNALIAAYRFTLPVESPQFKQNQPLAVINSGTFFKSHFFRLGLPSKLIITAVYDVFALDDSKCVSDICPINSVTLNQASRCARSLLSNQTFFCSNIESESPHCLFTRTSAGHLITTTNGIIFPATKSVLSARRIINATILLESGGKLLCQDHGMNSSHILSDPHIKNRYNSTFELEQPFQHALVLNITQINRQLALTHQFKTDIDNLYKLDDNLTVGQTQVPTILIIITSSLIITTTGILCVYCWKTSGLLKIFNLVKRWQNSRSERAHSTIGRMRKRGSQEEMTLSDRNNLFTRVSFTYPNLDHARQTDAHSSELDENIQQITIGANAQQNTTI